MVFQKECLFPYTYQILLNMLLLAIGEKQGEKLAQAPAREICSAGNADRIEDVFRGIPFHVFFGKGGDSENLPFTGTAKTCIPKYFVI